MSNDVQTIESPELAAYRLKAREWLKANMQLLPLRSDGTVDVPDLSEAGPERLAWARETQAKIHAAGYAGFTFPVEYGGQGLTFDHERVFTEESAPYDMPTQVFAVSINILGATLAKFASHEQKERHVRNILSGKEIFLQFLSEPSGGSDLAGLITRADRDGDSFILNGQKTWSTGAQHSDFALCPARTNWDVPKHRGITVFILDLRSPGVDIRRIKQINGGAEFCEEFITDVVVPAANIVGEENEGWNVARGLLEIEHSWVGRSGGGARRAKDVNEFIALARRKGLSNDEGVRRGIAQIYVNGMVQGHVAVRVSNGMAAGKLNHGYGGLLKLGNDIALQRRTEFGMALAGVGGATWDEDDELGDIFAQAFLGSRGMSIAGGTDEIQRNNVSERALGLPREPAFDRDMPFTQVPRN
ncbi:MAG: acyl-CoA dehydrogenase family protein [Acidimicrobiia bacterium]